jgi:hypothetical protein
MIAFGSSRSNPDSGRSFVPPKADKMARQTWTSRSKVVLRAIGYRCLFEYTTRKTILLQYPPSSQTIAPSMRKPDTPSIPVSQAKQRNNICDGNMRLRRTKAKSISVIEEKKISAGTHPIWQMNIESGASSRRNQRCDDKKEI